jgi:hypothetical protein
VGSRLPALGVRTVRSSKKASDQFQLIGRLERIPRGAGREPGT